MSGKSGVRPRQISEVNEFLTMGNDKNSPKNTQKSWTRKRLGEVCQTIGGGTPSRSQPKYWDGDIPWASVKDFTDDSVVLSSTQEHITIDGLATSASTLVPKDTPVICTRMAVGRCALTTMPTAINQDLKALLLNGEWDRKFFIRLLSFHRPNLDRSSIGSTVRGITTGDLLALPLQYPEMPEQSRIAAVLDTIDETIAKTEAVIAKLRQVRTGLLHDLLTCGLDENGQLRDPVAHPEQFQDSPLGRIPKAWAFESLGERLQRIGGTIQTGPFGSQLHAHEYTAEGVPVIMPQDIIEGSVSVAKIARILSTRADELKRHRVRLGDLVFARRGDLSRCAAITEREVGWLCGTGCLLMRFEETTLSSTWLSFAYQHNIGQRQIASRAVGTTMVNLNTKLLSHLQFGFPQKNEQDVAVCRVTQADSTIHQEEANLAKLALMKSGLMDDLLTGRVRVPTEVTADRQVQERGSSV